MGGGGGMFSPIILQKLFQKKEQYETPSPRPVPNNPTDNVELKMNDTIKTEKALFRKIIYYKFWTKIEMSLVSSCEKYDSSPENVKK